MIIVIGDKGVELFFVVHVGGECEDYNSILVVVFGHLDGP